MKKILCAVLAVVMVLALCACGSSAPAAPATPAAPAAPAGGDAPAAPAAPEAGLPDIKPIKLTLSMHDSEVTAQAKFMQAWADEVAEATNGKIQITLYCSSTLSAAPDVGTNVLEGAVDIGWLYTSYYAGQFPLTDVINLPMQGFGDPVVSTKVLWDLYDQYPEVQDEWSNFKLLMLYGNPGMILCSAEKPIQSMADIKGMTMRCPAGAATETLTAWGANPITMPPPDLYEAVQKKNINGYIFEPSGITNFSLEEVTKYYTDYALYDGPFALIMNKDKWDSIPAEYQAIIESLAGKAASEKAAQVFNDDVAVARDKIVAAGGEFVSLDDAAIAEFQAAADGVAQDWIAQRSENGFDAASFLATAKDLAK